MSIQGIVERLPAAAARAAAAIPLIAGAGIFLGWQLILHLLPQVELSAFCPPAAWLAGQLLGASALRLEDGTFLLPHRLIDVVVNNSCSGFGFFTLLHALLAATALRLLPRKQALTQIALFVPLAFAVAVLANTARIVSAVHARVTVAPLLPESFVAAVHLGVGVAVFFTTLAAMHHAQQMFYNYERNH